MDRSLTPERLGTLFDNRSAQGLLLGDSSRRRTMPNRGMKHPAWAASALTWAALSAAAATTTAVQQQNWSVAGLEEPADIVIDHWGIAHIFAANIHDAFFLQGYNAARDRLWQIDLWRKRGLGLLAKSFGLAYVDQDRAARLFLYRGDMTREWSSYAPGAQDTAAAFVAGINAYVEEV